MVKKLLKFLGFLLFFLLALMAFMPKESFYFLLEEQLKPHGVIISNEALDSRLFSLDIENLEISFKGIESGVIEHAKIKLLGIYNSVAFEKIELSSLVSPYLPPSIESATLSYTLLDPLAIKIEALGDFGEARGSLSILERSFEAKVKPSELMQMQYQKTLQMLQKDEDGEYSYAKTF